MSKFFKSDMGTAVMVAAGILLVVFIANKVAEKKVTEKSNELAADATVKK